VKTFEHEYPIENLCYNRKNDLIAISSSDLSLTILNVKGGLKKVREFLQVSENKITDICFSQPDCKWLLCTSLDKSLKVFDILTGSMIDWIKFRNAPLSLDFSLSGEFLATSHVGSKAIYLWTSKQYFQNVII
jgi:U3 small nucleolar RNA-associated protein 21